jgi:alkylation response protein AidB-like acyl-CoA dehydrogenase
MSSELTDELQLIRQTVREFALKEIGPRAAEIDATDEYPCDIVHKMGSLGLLGLPFTEKDGGSGSDYSSFIIVLEEVARVSGSAALILDAHTSLCCEPIALFGSEVQKATYLVPLAHGDKLGAFGLTEPQAGSDAGATRTYALRDGDAWVLNGQKIFITNGAQADVFVITAKTDPAGRRHGISSFIVERGTPGFRVGREEKKMGLRGTGTAELFFENCRIPAGNLLGRENDGFKQFLATLDTGRIAMAAIAIGLAQGAYEQALAYSQQRVQFDTQISKFQAIQWMIAEMATEIDAARLMLMRAAALKVEGKRFTKEAAMAKLFASEVSERVCYKAIQIHGGYGYMQDFAVERMYRDQRLCAIGEGTNEIQHLVIARHILDAS